MTGSGAPLDRCRWCLGGDPNQFDCDIDVVENVTVEVFIKQYWARDRPVLLRNALSVIDGWLVMWRRKALADSLKGLGMQVATTSEKASAPHSTTEKTLSKFWSYLEDQQLKLRKSYDQATPSGDMLVEARWEHHSKLHAQTA